jgi:hypothetical protein
MEPIGVFAVAIGIVCVVAIAAISLRSTKRRRGTRLGSGGPMIPMHHHDDGGDGFDG